MSTYTIGEVADRSGFSASALRYYEGTGLVAGTRPVEVIVSAESRVCSTDS